MSDKQDIHGSKFGTISSDGTPATKIQAEAKKNLLQFGRVIPIVLVPALTIIFCIYIVRIITGKPLAFFVDDPMGTYDLPFYTGLLSNLGVMLWAGAATSNLFGTRLFVQNNRLRWFFLTSLVITLWLGLDDLLMLHDRVFEVHLHIPEKVFYISYVILIGAYLIYFRNVIMMSTNYFILFTAMVFFMGSMILKTGFELSQLGIFVTDSIKFIGLAFLFYYYFQTIVDLSRRQGDISEL